MANRAHVSLLEQGVDLWNDWRRQNPDDLPDLSGALLSEANLGGADLTRAILTRANLSRAKLTKANLGEVDLSRAKLARANLSGAHLARADLSRASLTGATLAGANLAGANLLAANLTRANLSSATFTGARLTGAKLTQANLRGANLTGADFSGADLTEADLTRTDLTRADLTKADLTRANLRMATLVGTDLTNADLTGCRIHGVLVSRLILKEAKQQNLIITDINEPEITVDNIEFAQFVYFFLHAVTIPDVVDTIGKKGVLLFGRFKDNRIATLERLQDEIRKRNYLPIVFNFETPETKDFTQTVRRLASLSRFIIADITAPGSTPQDLQAVVPDCMVPFVPIIAKGEEPFAMFEGLWTKYKQWVFAPISYPSVEKLVQVLDEEIIRPALVRSDELVKEKAEKCWSGV
jgi:uncharacterized protein YjbI with pentapeptide repeats